MTFWDGRRVLVTGGASFIGSRLVERLVDGGARVRVADDLSSGRRSNLARVVDEIEFEVGDLRDASFADLACRGQEVVFHLAADHGGRGYVELHQVACAGNLALDQCLFSACLRAAAGKVVYASSGCVYPNYLQTDVRDELFLAEDLVGPPYEPDGMYGMAKLAGELTLAAMRREHGLPSASCRLFTVYGPRGVENHAIMAMIARAFLEEDPFTVWGTGEQVRNWTYVDDIVAGLVAAGERIDDATAVNLGTMERVTVREAAAFVLDYTGHAAELLFDADMPTGPLNRVADNSRAAKVLDWRPDVLFADGLRRTIDWYFASKRRDEVSHQLGQLLTERPFASRASS